ncbi:group II truncated hemoglobin [Novosphingobium sp. ZN18A2]|uniref:group II truncated hemoglobin n=1 Tax=Novosphingobium sp. ZN18A2 TaxID=3079861 RepID=UPI0030CA8E52
MPTTTDRQRDTLANNTVPATPFERIGGHDALRKITDRFYDLMESEPEYADLRAIHSEDLTHMRDALASFLAGWSGGPRDWFDANPGKCMMSLHAPFAISRNLAAQWATCMQRAIRETETPDTQIADSMSDVLFRMAMGMGRDPDNS